MSSTTFRIPALMVSVLALSACAENFNRDPQVSKVGVDPQSIYEAETAQVPMPAPQQARTPYRAEGASLWAHGSTGFFGDQRATQVGDILTVEIDIDDEAQLFNESDRTRSGGSTLAYPKFFGYGTQIDKILPGVGPDDLPSGSNIVDISSATGGSGSGSINRNESIELRVAALVVQILQNGNMVVVGRQEVKVNSELRELRVAGIIRPQDIDMDNTIPYDKMAEARISYGGRGTISDQQGRSWGEDIADIILPY
ncbi:flagellar basal body L-ring protein FlgH [Pseudooceanicola sp. LIPI14-2-Ac024]|uniref:flagellar basal body L-ring protein FlgH n=1 Tax=Pseudooceanicola sp. LIPI14-2-Ac024 TaxID=3344875 RepID=UPI0035CF451B